MARNNNENHTQQTGERCAIQLLAELRLALAALLKYCTLVTCIVSAVTLAVAK